MMAHSGTASPSPWIQSRNLDLVFYIAAPVFVIPLLLAFMSSNAPEKTALITTSFFGLGHHLPCFLRAYGDRVLFREYRWRFILGPLILVPVAAWFIFQEMKGYYFIILLWIAWHSAAQVFGLGRIYDAKIGKTGATSSWMDWTLIIGGFFAVILFSPWRFGGYLAVFYMTGGPYLSAQAIETAKSVVASAGSLFLVAYSIHYFSHRKLLPLTNHLKLFMYATNLSMWFFAFVIVRNVVVGLCIWEIVHFLQVVPLTWKFCRNRVGRVGEIGRFMTTLFSGKAIWVAAYAGLVLAYGSLGMVPGLLDSDYFYRVGTAVVVSSGILHFYFEGFIWRVRDRSVQEALGIGQQAGPPRWRFQHAALWLLFAAALGTMTYGQWTSTRTTLDIYKRITETVPDCWYSQYNLAVELEERGRLDEAAIHFRKSLAIYPKYTDSHLFLSHILMGRGEYEEVARHAGAALDLDPGNSLAQVFLGDALYRTGKPEAAKSQYLEIIARDPKPVRSLNNLAFVFMEQGDLAQAERYYARALALDSSFLPSKLNLSNLLVRTNRYDEAQRQIEAVLRMDPGNAVALEGMAHILRNHPDAGKRDTVLAVEYESRQSSPAAPDEPAEIRKDSRKTGTYRRPENIKIL